MSQTDPLKLPDSIYRRLVKAAKDSGTTPVDWIAARLKDSRNQKNEYREQPTREEIAEANVRLRRCTVSGGRIFGTDNEEIDRELAREYGNDHADLYHDGL